MLKGITDISSAQFDFRAGRSTDLCCNIHKQVVSRFIANGALLNFANFEFVGTALLLV